MNALDRRLTGDVLRVLAKHGPEGVVAVLIAVRDNFGIRGALEEAIHRYLLNDRHARPPLHIIDGGGT